MPAPCSSANILTELLPGIDTIRLGRGGNFMPNKNQKQVVRVEDVFVNEDLSTNEQ